MSLQKSKYMYIFWQRFDSERNWWRLFVKHIVRTGLYIGSYDVVNYYWVDTFVDELLVLDGIIRNK
jgi:hypothetical protein